MNNAINSLTRFFQVQLDAGESGDEMAILKKVLLKTVRLEQFNCMNA
jgi:hypothetical protein